MHPLLPFLVLGASSVLAHRPSNTSICDHYAKAALGASNATTQYTLLTLLVNTAVIGNYSNASKSAVPGILAANATYNSTAVNLAQYFDGSLADANRGGKSGVAVNFLDGGGAAPLKMNKPADSDSSNQYTLLTHLYQYFGTLLGCSAVGTKAFPAYSGFTSMYDVHKFMALDAFEVGYFISQVGAAATSLGVSAADVDAVAGELQKYFGSRCAKPCDPLPKQKEELQAICIAVDCPLASPSVCSAYGPPIEPKKAAAPGSSTNKTSSSSSSSSNSSSPGMSSSPAAGATGAGASPSATAVNFGARVGTAGTAGLVLVLGGLAVFML